MIRRVMLAAAMTGALFGGGLLGGGAFVASAHASNQSLIPPPCPPHTLIGTDQNGTYIWPPGCSQKIYLPATALPPKPSYHFDCDGLVVTAFNQNYDIDFLPCPGPVLF